MPVRRRAPQGCVPLALSQMVERHLKLGSRNIMFELRPGRNKVPSYSCASPETIGCLSEENEYDGTRCAYRRTWLAPLSARTRFSETLPRFTAQPPCSGGPGCIERNGLMTRRLCTGLILIVSYLMCTDAIIYPNAQPEARRPGGKGKKGPDNVNLPDREKPAASVYRVKEGDTLYAIAGSHGTTVRALKSVNGLRSNRLRIGQKLTIPGKAAGPVKSPASQQTERPALPAQTATADEARVPEDPASGEEEETGGTAPSAVLANGVSDTSTQPLRYRLASAGLEFLGTRYRWNGLSARSGFDCSGLVKTLFEKFSIVLPRSSREQYKVGEKVEKDNLEVGDLVFFSSTRGRTPTHVGIYLGDDMFMHAARKARKVIISNLTQAWYTKRFLGARRLSDLWQEDSKPATDSKPQPRQ